MIVVQMLQFAPTQTAALSAHVFLGHRVMAGHALVRKGYLYTYITV